MMMREFRELGEVRITGRERTIEVLMEIHGLSDAAKRARRRMGA
jgi:hypothetical protein